MILARFSFIKKVIACSASPVPIRTTFFQKLRTGPYKDHVLKHESGPYKDGGLYNIVAPRFGKGDPEIRLVILPNPV